MRGSGKGNRSKISQYAVLVLILASIRCDASSTTSSSSANTASRQTQRPPPPPPPPPKPISSISQANNALNDSSEKDGADTKASEATKSQFATRPPPPPKRQIQQDDSPLSKNSILPPPPPPPPRQPALSSPKEELDSSVNNEKAGVQPSKEEEVDRMMESKPKRPPPPPPPLNAKDDNILMPPHRVSLPGSEAERSGDVSIQEEDSETSKVDGAPSKIPSTSIQNATKTPPPPPPPPLPLRLNKWKATQQGPLSGGKRLDAERQSEDSSITAMPAPLRDEEGRSIDDRIVEAADETKSSQPPPFRKEEGQSIDDRIVEAADETKVSQDDSQSEEIPVDSPQPVSPRPEPVLIQTVPSSSNDEESDHQDKVSPVDEPTSGDFQTTPENDATDIDDSKADQEKEVDTRLAKMPPAKPSVPLQSDSDKSEELKFERMKSKPLPASRPIHPQSLPEDLPNKEASECIDSVPQRISKLDDSEAVQRRHFPQTRDATINHSVLPPKQLPAQIQHASEAKNTPRPAQNSHAGADTAYPSSRVQTYAGRQTPPPPPPPQRHQLQQSGRALPPGPLPQQQRQTVPTNKPSKASSAPPVFKSLWSRVEKGFDELASLDEKVAYRAQKLMYTAVNTPWRRQTSKPTQRSQPTASTIPTASERPMSTPRARWQQQHANQNKAAQSADQHQSPLVARPTKATNDGSKPSVTVHPYAASSYSALDMAKSKHSPPGEKEFVRQADWSPLLGKARRLMPANGGASAPNDSQKPNQPGSQDSPFELPNGPGGNVLSRDRPDGVTSSAGGLQRPSEAQASGPAGIPPPAQLQRSSLQQHHYPVNVQQDSGAMSSKNPGRRDGPQTPKPEAQTKTFAETFRSSMAAPAKSGVSAVGGRSSPASYAEDEDDKVSFISRIVGAIPVPHPRFSSFRRLFKLGRGNYDNNYASLDAWSAEDANAKKTKGLFGIFRKRTAAGGNLPAGTTKKASIHEGALPQQVQSLIDRSDKGITGSLLGKADAKRIRKVGKSRSLLDVISLAFLLVGIRQLQGLEEVAFPGSLSEFASLTLPGLLTAVFSSFDTWAPLAVASAILAVWTNSLLFDGRINTIATEVAESAEAEASYSRLFLRLIASTSSDRGIPNKIFQAARSEVIALGELSRLRSFVTYVIATILFLKVTFVQPFLRTLFLTLFQVGNIQEWRQWPIHIHLIASKAKDILVNGGHELTSLVAAELKGAGHHTLQVAFKASILAALFAVACLPRLEKRRKVVPSEESEEENTEEASLRMAEQLTNLGVSSAGRLGLLHKQGWVEGSIERWRIIQEESSKMTKEISIGSLFRRMGYSVASWVILAMPLVVFGFLLNVPVIGWSSPSLPQWEALLEVAVLLLFTNGLVWKTVAKVVEAIDLRPDIIGFLESLSRTGEEVIQKKSTQRSLTTASVNPTAGLQVKDLWAAHTVKRAWAVRGANLACRNGEVLVLLGDDGSGKSRLLTTLAESMILPPKRAISATKVRGNISFGGIDVTQWDHTELKKRVGIFLNDIRTMADMADLWSGMSVEEILEPGDGLKAIDPTHASGAAEKACMVLALKITSLYWTLMPRLPSKLSSVLTANEEDLRPSPLRPRYNVLSPTEWSKLMMAKLLAQQIFDNENSSGSSDKVDNCLVGSLFLLDDATMLLSETEETKLLRELRRTGAATVLTSNKWATGRLADRIAVVKDGAIVESGTHNELLSRGPQQSLYAAKWHAMTSP